MNFILIDPGSGENSHYENLQIVDFLHAHLEEFGDKKEDILKSIEYALNPSRGGMLILGEDNKELTGAVVINRTGMDGYIPANILVYIAIHKDHRGKGLGKKMMQEAMRHTRGGIALHVEPENPAKFLYEKLGFTNKYLEMRYQPDKEK